MEPGRKILAHRLDQLCLTLECLGTQLRGTIVNAIGETIGGIVRDTALHVLDEAVQYLPGHEPGFAPSSRTAPNPLARENFEPQERDYWADDDEDRYEPDPEDPPTPAPPERLPSALSAGLQVASWWLRRWSGRGRTLTTLAVGVLCDGTRLPRRTSGRCRARLGGDGHAVQFPVRCHRHRRFGDQRFQFRMTPSAHVCCRSEVFVTCSLARAPGNAVGRRVVEVAAPDRQATGHMPTSPTRRSFSSPLEHSPIQIAPKFKRKTNTMTTMIDPHANGRKRASLNEQINRLDTMLDGLSDGLNEAVADAVKSAVGTAVKEAVQAVLTEVLTNPEIRAQVPANVGGACQGTDRQRGARGCAQHRPTPQRLVATGPRLHRRPACGVRGTDAEGADFGCPKPGNGPAGICRLCGNATR